MPSRPIELSTSGLKACWTWSDDRWQHQVSLPASEEEELAWLESVEGDSMQRWPPSPVLQDTDELQLPGTGMALMAVGMAGQSHWSLTVQVDSEAGLTFDVACRVKSPPAWIGSQYRVANDCRVACPAGGEFAGDQFAGAEAAGKSTDESEGVAVTERQACISLGREVLKLRLVSDGSIHWHPASRYLSITPPETAWKNLGNTKPITIRWIYCLSK